jgi:hypothetical protein
MLKAIFEPYYIDIFHKFGEVTSKIPAGTILMKDTTNAEYVKVSNGTDFWGVLSQDLYPDPGSEYIKPYNDHRAYSGDQVGIYHKGMFETDQFEEDGAYIPGDTLYASADGKFCNGYEMGDGTAVDGTTSVTADYAAADATVTVTEGEEYLADDNGISIKSSSIYDGEYTVTITEATAVLTDSNEATIDTFEMSGISDETVPIGDLTIILKAVPVSEETFVIELLITPFVDTSIKTATITFTGPALAKLNDHTITFAAESDITEETVVFDGNTNKLTVTLIDSKDYDLSDIETLIVQESLFAGFKVTTTEEGFVATGTEWATAADVTLSGGADPEFEAKDMSNAAVVGKLVKKDGDLITVLII